MFSVDGLMTRLCIFSDTAADSGALLLCVPLGNTSCLCHGPRCATGADMDTDVVVVVDVNMDGDGNVEVDDER